MIRHAGPPVDSNIMYSWGVFFSPGLCQYTYRSNQVRKLKEGANVGAYLERYPDAYLIHKPLCVSTLEHWENEGYCKALDGCHVEPDGTCEHGKPSWLMALGMI